MGSAVDLVDSICLGFSGRVSGLCVDYLELDRGESTQPSLSSSAVVGPLDPGHDLEPKFLPGLPPFLIQDVLLQKREERL